MTVASCSQIENPISPCGAAAVTRRGDSVNIKGCGRNSPRKQIAADSWRVEGGATGLCECHTDATFLPPNNIAMLSSMVCHHIQRDFVWNAYRACDIEPCANRREVANCAVDAGAIELNRPGLEDSSSWRCTSLFHWARLSATFKRLANHATESRPSAHTIGLPWRSGRRQTYGLCGPLREPAGCRQEQRSAACLVVLFERVEL
jgi:hypothetical protein